MADIKNFLTNLGNTLGNQFGLGKISNSVDQSAERAYIEEGASRVDFYNYRPKQLDILMQEPDITVLVKKRAFSSLAENFRSDLMDQQEKLFLRTTKVLFKNKCAQISAYEKLFKISTVSADVGAVDAHLLPIIFAATDTITQGIGAIGLNPLQGSINDSLSGFKNIVDRVREIVALSQDNFYTTWINGIPDSFRSDFTSGTGVIEFTNVTSLSTTTSLEFGKGSFILNFSDPYEIMLITNLDVEQAIIDATSVSNNNSFIQLGISSLDDAIAAQKNMLSLARTGRGVNTITFIVSPDAYLNTAITAVIDRIGFQIHYDSSGINLSAKIGSDVLGSQGLNDNETGIFNTIISMLTNQISLATNSRRQAMADNQDPTKNINAIRKKLRLHYGNKLVIQPMDNIHIFINSKKKIDSKIIGGLQGSFSAQGFMQGVNNLTQDIKDIFAINENYSLEKTLFVGSDFPDWLWQILRNQFVSDKNGAHVFAGVVDKATSLYSKGSFNVNVNGKDNSAYFTYGIVNFKPAIDVFNGSLYDPLTPFKLEFDSTTGALGSGDPKLLDENLGLFNSAFVKNKNGLLAGLVTTEKNFYNQDADRVKNNSVRRVFYDPDGMVYRWKEGIATLVLFGDSYESSPSNNLPPAITSEPFAGQDIINILSLLITGEPYNFATFYKAAIQFDNFKRDAATNQDPSGSYFRGLKSQLKAKNAIYGNFIPFKKLTVDSATNVKIINNQLSSIKFDSQLNDLIKERATIADTLAIFGKTSANSLQASPSAQDNAIAARLKGIDEQIANKVQQINTELNSSGSSPFTDASFDSDNMGLNIGSKTDIDPNDRKDLIRKIDFLTRRLAWKTRANEDVNLLIVDDTFDKDPDIQIFNKKFVNPELFRSEYTTVADKISSVSKVISGIEVFANTQGHIEIRNPKYNRVPSSVFYKMLKMKNELGIQIFPQFLEDLFSNQINQLNSNIEILEDEIRLYCLALGKVSDSDCETFINFNNITSGAPGGFSFISDPDTGKIIPGSLNMTIQSQPDIVLNNVQTKLSSQTSVGVFTPISVAKIVQSNVIPPGSSDSPTQFKNLSQIRQIDGGSSREQKITTRLQQNSGQNCDLTQLFSNTKNSAITLSNNVSSVDILQITSGIAGFLSSRQNAIKLAANAVKTLVEGMTLFDGGGGTGDQSGGNSLLSPALYDSRSMPQVFQNMIEDESYDDLGLNSSKRYVIKNHDILTYSISENRPTMTSVEVTGRLGDLFIDNSELPSDLQIGEKGNAIITAAAVDYDLWRMYGMNLPQSIDAPFLSDPDGQCAPYAVSLLNMARKNILQGQIEIIGNEFQQPGEVIYIESRDLLFYVNSVTHQFTFGQTFKTSLDISYGHNPGEYIPTFLDVIGKILYKNKDITALVHKRQGNVFNQEYLGTIVGNTGSVDDTSFSSAAFGTSANASSSLTDSTSIASSSDTVNNDITSGQYGDSNKLALQNIIDLAGQTLSASATGSTAKLEVRVYFNKSNGSFASPSSYAKQLQDSVMTYLKGSSGLDLNVKPTGNPNSNTQSLSAFSDNIKSVDVDADPKNVGEFRYPSAKAFYFARQAANKNTSNTPQAPSQQQVDNIIYNFIVDCWIVFQNPNTNNGTKI